MFYLCFWWIQWNSKWYWAVGVVRSENLKWHFVPYMISYTHFGIFPLYISCKGKNKYEAVRCFYPSNKWRFIYRQLIVSFYGLAVKTGSRPIALQIFLKIYIFFFSDKEVFSLRWIFFLKHSSQKSNGTWCP